MKKLMHVLVPLLLSVLLVISVGWYLFVYDRDFTRDLLLQQARNNDIAGNSGLSSWFYNLAYNYSGQDENVAIELANQYKSAGNYTKAEVTLSKAIAAGATKELYMALSKTYVEQDKLLDAETLMSNITNPTILSELEARPLRQTTNPATIASISASPCLPPKEHCTTPPTETIPLSRTLLIPPPLSCPPERPRSTPSV